MLAAFHMFGLGQSFTLESFQLHFFVAFIENLPFRVKEALFPKIFIMIESVRSKKIIETFQCLSTVPIRPKQGNLISNIINLL